MYIFIFSIFKSDLYFYITILVLLAGMLFFNFLRSVYVEFVVKKRKFRKEWRDFLNDKVVFYNKLSPDEKHEFEERILEFMYDYDIVGHDNKITILDKILVAASGIIPVFAFDTWVYEKLETIYLFNDSFNLNFESVGGDNTMNGLVGSGFMKGKMYLSKPALYLGFSNEKDHRNTAIHEFLHLIDMDDDLMDGVPENILEKQYIIPWIDLMEKEIERIHKGESVLGDYAGVNKMEFFAEVGVFFFENPKLLEKHNKPMYEILKKTFLKKRTTSFFFKYFS